MSFFTLSKVMGLFSPKFVLSLIYNDPGIQGGHAILPPPRRVSFVFCSLIRGEHFSNLPIGLAFYCS